MRRVLGLLMAAAVTVGISWWLAGLPGEVLISVAGLVVETRSGIAVLAAVLLLAVLFIAMWLLLAVLHIPRNLRRWRARRRRDTGDAAVTTALVTLAAAEPDAARAAARRARDLLGDTPQTLLLDAEANRLAGRDGEAAAIYRRMESREDAAFLGLRGLFRQAMAREDWAAAAAIAGRAAKARPGGAWLREERLALAARIGDWEQAQGLAEPGPPRLAFATAAAQAAASPDRVLVLAKRAWKLERGFTPAALIYAAALRSAGREGKAQSVLAEAWREFPHPALAESALAPLTDTMARMAAATKLGAGAAEHGETHFLLAHTALDAGLTGEARRHIAAARAAGLAQKRLFLLIAALEAAEHGGAAAGQAAQRDALLQAAAAEPDPAWHCDACGTAHPEWHPACPACHAAGRLRWGGPPRVALPAG
ncbi:MAG: heme biosynthesis protein HemY [Alphaproteobacteria bacterium]|nr:heme biosynthesis protein HemY [Alphaproteobacteria bacterium]